MEPWIYLTPLFFATALIYSTAGFGGGSTYLALMALFGISFVQMPQIALLCNVVVVAEGFYLFWKEGHLVPRRVLPFLLASVPAAFLGGLIPIGQNTFLFLLGLSLACAGLRLLITTENFQRRDDGGISFRAALPWGAGIGFLSGLTGIGGGVFLAPLLYFKRWGNAKQVAVASAGFILVNSLAGLAGQIQKSSWTMEAKVLLPLVLVVALGGQIGGRLGAGRISKPALQRVTAALILFVAARIFWRLW